MGGSVNLNCSRRLQLGSRFGGSLPRGCRTLFRAEWHIDPGHRFSHEQLQGGFSSRQPSSPALTGIMAAYFPDLE
jgi:hypothetical protein